MRILLVEDDDVLAQLLSQHLMTHHYAVDIATDGEIGWDHVQTVTYDLILLDIDLPKLDGISLCKRMRHHRHEEPVLLLTARSQVANKVQGLDAGADDYLIKPYSIDELLARVRALFRRQENGSKMPLLTWGPLCLDPKLCELTVENKVIALSPKEYQLIELLLRHPKQVLSSDRILDHIWGFNDIPGKETVRTHMRRLRKKLKPMGAERWIETVYGLGYRLKALNEDSKPQDRHSITETENNTALSQPLLKFSSQEETALKSVGEVPAAPLESKATQDMARQASLTLWPKFRSRALAHLATLENAIASFEQALSLQDNGQSLHVMTYAAIGTRSDDNPTAASEFSTICLDKQLCHEGKRVAHKLVGTLGMFGMPEGSVLACQMEKLFQKLCSLQSPHDEEIISIVTQLRVQLKPLHHLITDGRAEQRLNKKDSSTHLLSYQQARPIISKYCCLARRHHHAITFVWIKGIKPRQEQDKNPLSSTLPSHLTSQTQGLAPSSLLSWAVSVQSLFREEDIITQSSEDTILLVFFACTRDNAWTRLKPMIKPLLGQSKKDNSGHWQTSTKIHSIPLQLSLKLSEFPKDSDIFDFLNGTSPPFTGLPSSSPMP